MAGLRDCIDVALDTGKITQKQATELQGRVDAYDKLTRGRADMSPERAFSEAEKKAMAEQIFETRLRKRQAVLQAVALNKAIENISAHPAGKGTGVMSMLVKDLGQRAGYSNVDNRAHAILASYHAQFADAMSRFRTKNLGFSQDKEGLHNMVRELFGTATDDKSASNLAKVWSETAEVARLRFNKAGGAIAKREDWGLPQYHDALRVGRTSKDDWIEEILPALNREKMLDDTGRPMNDSQVLEMLDHSYDTIRTDGLIDMVPGKMGRGKLANGRRDHRILPFKDADSWLKYHEKYGHQDIYTTLTDHLSGMAHDTAMLEIFGPNPEVTFKHLRDMAKMDGYDGLKLAMLDSVYDTISGKVNATKSVRLADTMQAIRHYLVSAKLGGAFLSAMSDTAFLRHTTKFNGMEPVKVFKRMSRLLNPANEADRLVAVKAQLTADAWVNRALAANRFTDVTGSGFSARVADFTMRASALSAWTDAGRKAFGMEFQGFIADNASKQWKNLNKPLQRTMKNYGITPDEWDAIRKTKPFEHKGVKFFSPENLAKTGDVDLTTKVQEMILTETDFAVPTPDSRSRAITTGSVPRGTIIGETVRSLSMFKSFPITVIMTHMYKGALQEGMQNKLKYLGALTLSTTVMGGVALQLKDIARGREPRDMDDPKFWAAAYVQGGGAGIYSDFLFSDVNRFGGGIVETMAGPMAGAINDATKFTLGNVQQAIKGEDMKLGADAVRLLKNYTPGGSLWYARLAYERTVLDQLQKAADPKAGSKFRRAQRKRKKEYGQDHWWKPGKVMPELKASGGN